MQRDDLILVMNLMSEEIKNDLLGVLDGAGY